MVITKSVTRLARNTVILLETARELRDLGIDIYFEKENIHTMSADGELMLTLLASFAQEESWSASENQKWRIRKTFEQGLTTAVRLYGYRFKDGTLQIVPEEAEVVQMIFTDFLSGMGRTAIAKKLNRMEIPPMYGERWNSNTLYKILRQEKYAGDMLLQKTYRPDPITKVTKINHGEVPMYFVENSHKAIIDRETFERTQQELKRRVEKLGSYKQADTPYLFTSLVRCGFCGRHFRRKSVASGKRYEKKPVWICSTFHTFGKDSCPAQQVPEAILIAKTSEVLHTASLERNMLLEQMEEIRVPEHNHLIYIFKDGHSHDVFWQNPSRRESWTEEMKQKAREHQLKVHAERRKNQNVSQENS